MSPGNLFLGIAIVAAVWGVVTTVAIAGALQNRGIKINWIFLIVLILKYLGRYREVTKKEFGKPGPPFYSYIISMNLALVTGIIGLLLR